MSTNELKHIIGELYNDVSFSYKGKTSGITSIVHNSIPLFQVWHGEDTKEYNKIDDLMTDPFFSGKSITELAEDLEFIFS